MSKPILKVESLHVFFGKSHILQGVDIELCPGITTILGRNGMGKTTLMNAIMGIVRSSGGRIELKGQEITNKKPFEIARLGIGYVPQGRRVFPSLTVEEQLTLAAKKRTNADLWDLDKIYDFFPNLKERRKHYGNTISGGEQQMLAIGRALMLNPNILIMDEPSEGLAPILIEQLIDFCDKIKDTDLYILLVEQSMYFAAKVSESVNIMQNGKFVYKGSLSELLEDKVKTKKLIGLGV